MAKNMFGIDMAEILKKAEEELELFKKEEMKKNEIKENEIKENE